MGMPWGGEKLWERRASWRKGKGKVCPGVRRRRGGDAPGMLAWGQVKRGLMI